MATAAAAATNDLEARRDAQVDLEHAYYEDSGLADEHARKVTAFQAKLLASVAPAAARHQRVLAGAEAPADDLVAAGMPPGHSLDKFGPKPRSNILGLAILKQQQFENPNDVPVLRHCVGVDVTPCDAPKAEPEAPAGILVTLRFAKNEYFANATISRTFGIATTASDDIDIVSADNGTVIEWYPGKDVTHKLQKRTSSGAPAVKAPVMSIFRLFIKDGFKEFGPQLAASMLSAVKPLIKIAVFTVHVGTGTRTHGEAALDEGEEGDEGEE